MIDDHSKGRARKSDDVGAPIALRSVSLLCRRQYKNTREGCLLTIANVTEIINAIVVFPWK